MSRILIFPFIILAAIMLYCIYSLEMEFMSLYLIPCIVIPVAIFIFSPQIDWWWLKRNPPKMADELKHFLLDHNAFYANLSPFDKKKFQDRVGLYMWAREFIPKEIETVPDDIKFICAQYAIQFTMNHSDFLMGDNDRVVIYKHPFVSPRYPKIFHVSEFYEEDGVLIFSMDRMLPGYLEPTLYFPSAAYEYAKLYFHLYPEKRPVPEAILYFMQHMDKVGFNENYIKEFIAIPDIDWKSVCLVYYFIYQESFKSEFPDLGQYFSDLFQPKIVV